MDDDGLEPLIFRRNKRPNAEQVDNYLALLIAGYTHVEAAHKVGSTGTAFRALTRRDPHFAKRRQLAEGYQREAMPDRIRESLFTRAFDEADPRSWEALKLIAEIYLPELDYKRTRRQETQITGALHHLLDIPLDALQNVPDAKLNQLIGLLEELKEAADAPALPAVIDA